MLFEFKLKSPAKIAHRRAGPKRGESMFIGMNLLVIISELVSCGK